MKAALLPLALLALAGPPVAAQAAAPGATIAGTVEGGGAADSLRVGGFVVTAFGQPIQEIASVPVTGGRFRLDLPGATPPVRGLYPLSAGSVSWPGVVDPVEVSTAAQTAELKLYAYRDENANGRNDDGEALREVSATAGRGALFVAWVSADVTVKGNKGYVANLKRGWNVLAVDVGRTVRVQPVAATQAVSLRLGR